MFDLQDRFDGVYWNLHQGLHGHLTCPPRRRRPADGVRFDSPCPAPAQVVPNVVWSPLSPGRPRLTSLPTGTTRGDRVYVDVSFSSRRSLGRRPPRALPLCEHDRRSQSPSSTTSPRPLPNAHLPRARAPPCGGWCPHGRVGGRAHCTHLDLPPRTRPTPDGSLYAEVRTRSVASASGAAQAAGDRASSASRSTGPWRTQRLRYRMDGGATYIRRPVEGP